jgi:Uma2 family endonuclease
MDRANADNLPDRSSEQSEDLGWDVPAGRVTERQCVAWAASHTDLRIEWVDGKVEVLSPESTDHDALHRWLSNILNPLVQERGMGELYGPNMWVRLPKQRRRRTPDLCFVAKSRSRIVQRTVIDGAPDVAFEIVSPESQSRDRREKYRDYEKAGVREYWIIDPVSRTVEVYALRRKEFVPVRTAGGVFKSAVIAGFALRPDDLWKRPLPSVVATLRAFGLIK